METDFLTAAIVMKGSAYPTKKLSLDIFLSLPDLEDRSQRRKRRHSTTLLHTFFGSETVQDN